MPRAMKFYREDHSSRPDFTKLCKEMKAIEIKKRRLREKGINHEEFHYQDLSIFLEEALDEYAKGWALSNWELGELVKERARGFDIDELEDEADYTRMEDYYKKLNSRNPVRARLQWLNMRYKEDGDEIGDGDEAYYPYTSDEQYRLSSNNRQKE